VMVAGLVQPFWIPLHVVTFFAVAIVCHGQLAGLRPEPGALTVYYLMIALGGAMGAVFNALVAPQVFDSMAEYPAGLFLACLCLPGMGTAMRRRWLCDALIPMIIGIVTVLLVRDVGGVAQSALGVIAVILVSGLALLITVKARRRPLRFALGVAALLAGGGLS